MDPLDGIQSTLPQKSRVSVPKLVEIMIQEVGVNVHSKRALWVKPRPDYEPLFSILDDLHLDEDRRFWIGPTEAQEVICDIEADLGYKSTDVNISLQLSNNSLTSVEECVK